MSLAAAQVPPGYNPVNQYRLRIEGYSRRVTTSRLLITILLFRLGGAMIFTNETLLEFSQKFLSISISTNKVVFTAIHTMKVFICSNNVTLLPFTPRYE